MMKLSEKLRNDVDYIWKNIFKHPYIIEIFSGELPIEKFIFYIKQDYNYLIGIMRAFSIIASKSEYKVSKLALETAYQDAIIEIENYNRLLKKLNIPLDDVLSTEPSPINTAYMNFLISTCSLGSSLDGLVATLPCFWSYLEIAEVNKHLLNNNRNKLYRDWCITYLSRDYIELTNKLINMVDELWDGREYDKFKNIFITASRYEYMFWNTVYKMEEWPI